MNSKINDLLAEAISYFDRLEERRGGVFSLSFPGDCTSRDLLRAAQKDAVVKAGGNHDSVYDPKTGKMITQIPRHSGLKSGTCRGIIKDLKTALKKADDEEDDK